MSKQLRGRLDQERVDWERTLEQAAMIDFEAFFAVMPNQTLKRITSWLGESPDSFAPFEGREATKTIARRFWSEDTPFDFDGEFFRYEGAFSAVKPLTPGASLSTSRALPPRALKSGAAQADVYAFWGSHERR